VNLLVHNKDTKKGNSESLIDVSTEVDLEINAEKTKYMLLSRHQNAGQIHDRYFQNVAQLKYLGRTLKNQNSIEEEIKRSLNWGNASVLEAFLLLVCCLKT
jgi:hypothetical protein